MLDRRKNRGAYDFEASQWVNAEACGILTSQGFELVARDRKNKRDTPQNVAVRALKRLAERTASEGVDEWWAHNGGKYDLILLLEAIGALSWRANGSVSGGRLIILDVRTPDGVKMRFLDSYAVVPEPLKKVGESFNLKSSKLLGEEDYSVPASEWSHQRLYDGCRADCEVVFELVERLDQLYTDFGGQLCFTFSSSTLSVLRGTCEVLETRKWTAHNRFAERAYYGGRVEVYHHMPTYKLRSYDVTSSYPWSMAQRLPWLPQRLTTRSKEIEWALKEENIEAIVDADVSVPAAPFPVLPIRHDDSLFFPTGNFAGTWTKPELLYARSQGVKVTPRRALLYTSKVAFADFVKKFFELKANSEGALRSFAKLSLNGCYGKFGQKPERETLHICESPLEAVKFIESKPKGAVTPLSNRDLRFLAHKEVAWPRQTHFAIAAYVTSYSRILFHHRLVNSIHPTYGDTDSIHCESTNLKNSPWETGFGVTLGAWKLERQNFTARYYAPKLYALSLEDGESKFKSKGFEVKPEIFDAVTSGEQVERGAMRLTKSALRDDLKAKYHQVKKSWHGASQKRRAFPDGSTTPWTFRELTSGKYLHQVSPLGKEAFEKHRKRNKK